MSIHMKIFYNMNICLIDEYISNLQEFSGHQIQNSNSNSSSMLSTKPALILPVSSIILVLPPFYRLVSERLNNLSKGTEPLRVRCPKPNSRLTTYSLLSFRASSLTCNSLRAEVTRNSFLYLYST